MTFTESTPFRRVTHDDQHIAVTWDGDGVSEAAECSDDLVKRQRRAAEQRSDQLARVYAPTHRSPSARSATSSARLTPSASASSTSASRSDGVKLAKTLHCRRSSPFELRGFRPRGSLRFFFCIVAIPFLLSRAAGAYTRSCAVVNPYTKG